MGVAVSVFGTYIASWTANGLKCHPTSAHFE